MQRQNKKRLFSPKYQAGFTLIELLIALGVSSILLLGVLRVYDDIQTSSSQQIEFNMLQQNQRGVLAIMERELRMIGMESTTPSGDFRIIDVRSYSVTAPGTPAIPDNTAAGNPVLQFTVDLDGDGTIDDPTETITYMLYDRDGDGTGFDLARSETAGPSQDIGRQLLAEGIEALEFAYAFDADGDDQIDRAILAAGEPPSIVWAVDSDNDGDLDADLAGAALNATYQYEDGTAFPVRVQPKDIRAVQIWILGRALRTDRKYVNQHQYNVGSRPPMGPFNDRIRRWLLSEVIHCRNL